MRVGCVWLPVMPEGEPVRLAAWWMDVLEALSEHTPAVEDVGLGRAYLDAVGMGALYGGEARWCEAVLRAAATPALDDLHPSGWRLGVAATKFGADLAARAASANPGYRSVPSPERRWLAPFPVDYLPLDQETLRRCRLLGIRTMGQFAALPATSVAEQFGAEALTAHAWARGRDDRPLAGMRREVVELRRVIGPAEARSDSLAAMLVAAAEPAIADLKRRGLIIRRLVVEAGGGRGATVTRSAWLDDLPGPETLRRTLARLVEGLAGTLDEVDEIALRLTGLDAHVGRQMDLFADTAERLRLEQTLRRLVRKHGEPCVQRAVLSEPYAPVAPQRYELEPYPL